MAGFVVIFPSVVELAVGEDELFERDKKLSEAGLVPDKPIDAEALLSAPDSCL